MTQKIQTNNKIISAGYSYHMNINFINYYYVNCVFRTPFQLTHLICYLVLKII